MIYRFRQESRSTEHVNHTVSSHALVNRGTWNRFVNNDTSSLEGFQPVSKKSERLENATDLIFALLVEFCKPRTRLMLAAL